MTVELKKWARDGKVRYYINDVPTAYDSSCFIEIKDDVAKLVFNEPNDAVMVDIAYDRITEVIGENMLNAFIDSGIDSISVDDFEMYMRGEDKVVISEPIRTKSNLLFSELNKKLTLVNSLLKKTIREESDFPSFINRPHYNQYLLARDNLQGELLNCFLEGGTQPLSSRMFSLDTTMHHFGNMRY